MSQTEREIGEEIKMIAARPLSGEMYPIMSCVFGITDETDMTVTARITGDEIDCSGVLLNVVLDNVGGVYMVPEEGADGFVMQVDGDTGAKWEMLKASRYKKIVLGADMVIQFNEGALGGLTKTKVLKTELDKVKRLLEHVVNVIVGGPISEPGSGASSAFQAALKTAIAGDNMPNFDEIENEKVIH